MCSTALIFSRRENKIPILKYCTTVVIRTFAPRWTMQKYRRRYWRGAGAPSALICCASRSASRYWILYLRTSEARQATTTWDFLHFQGVFGRAVHPATQYPQCHHRRRGGGGHGGQCNCLVGQCLGQRRQFQRQLVFVGASARCLPLFWTAGQFRRWCPMTDWRGRIR